MITIDVSTMLKDIAIMTNSRMEVITDVMMGVAETARQRIAKIAEDKLSTRTWEVYHKGLQPVHRDSPGNVSIELIGEGPNAFEQGFESFDMREKMLKGRESVNIQFEFAKEANPGPKGLQPMPATAARSLASAIKEGKKALKGKGGTFQARGGNFAKEKPNWSTSKGSGMRATVTVPPGPGKKASVSEPTTVRKMSRNSPPGSWVHPGLDADKAVNAFETVAEEIKPLLEASLREALGR